MEQNNFDDEEESEIDSGETSEDNFEEDDSYEDKQYKNILGCIEKITKSIKDDEQVEDENENNDDEHQDEHIIAKIKKIIDNDEKTVKEIDMIIRIYNTILVDTIEMNDKLCKLIYILFDFDEELEDNYYAIDKKIYETIKNYRLIAFEKTKDIKYIFDILMTFTNMVFIGYSYSDPYVNHGNCDENDPIEYYAKEFIKYFKMIIDYGNEKITNASLKLLLSCKFWYDHEVERRGKRDAFIAHENIFEVKMDIEPIILEIFNHLADRQIQLPYKYSSDRDFTDNGTKSVIGGLYNIILERTNKIRDLERRLLISESRPPEQGGIQYEEALKTFNETMKQI